MDLYKNAQNTDIESLPVYDENTELGSIFCLTRGDITKLKADAYAISNSANLSHWGGVNGQICRVAGGTASVYADNVKKALAEADKKCLEVGECLAVKATKRLTCEWVLHTNAPGTNNPDALKTCYTNILNEAARLKLGSIVFCSLGTGGKGFFPDAAAQIALQTCATFIKKHIQSKSPTIRRICFCPYTDQDEKCYQQLLPYVCK